MPAHADSQVGWRAELALEYARRGERTVLAARRHDGPLVVQKPLYPEGDAVCHTIVVHPPGGLAGGDDIDLSARLEGDARALLTTPGATRWYRSAGAPARQRIRFDGGAGSCLEWLPQENIFFDGARAELFSLVQLTGEASFIGWEIFCFGRTGSGEKFSHGALRARTMIERDGKPVWLERVEIVGGGAALQSPVVLAGQPVAGTLLAASDKLDAHGLAACREIRPLNGDGAVTLLPGLLIGRYLGASSEAAKNYFIELWHKLRPVVAGRDAIDPRIWRT